MLLREKGFIVFLQVDFSYFTQLPNMANGNISFEGIVNCLSENVLRRT